MMADYFTRVPGPLEVMRRLGLNVPSRKQVGKLFTAVPEFVGPQADVAGMVRDAGQVMPNIRSGDYGQAALNTLAAAAAIPMMFAPGTVSQIKGVTKKITDELPMDTASRMARAKEMGFDVDTPMYHGTRAKNIKGFDDSLIGSVHDSGYYGRGHYFADTSGEAKYYGPNVGEYATNAKLFDLSNETGDATFRGNFKSFAKKLDKIGALDKDQKQALKAINKAEKYVDNNIEYLVGQNPDNTTGIYAKVKNPVSGKYPEEFSVRTGYAGKYPETKKEALENLKDTFIYEMETFYPEQFPGLGTQSASLSDYIRADSTLGSSGLTEKVKEAGFEGIRVGSETVIFDPTKIRSLKAKFDPSKKTSANLLAGAAGGMLFAPAFMDNE